MAICQYFLKGTCKFGSNCRNEHPTGGTGFGKSNSFSGFSKNQSGGNAFRWQKGGYTDEDTKKLLGSIKQQMVLWENSKMWLYSCFSYQTDTPCMSGLLDFSPEELRLEAYKANESGNSNEYINNVKQIDSQFARRRAELKSLTPESWEQEKQKMSGQNTSGLFKSQSSASAMFSGPSMLFSSQPAQAGASNPFAAAASSQNVFKGQSVFGQPSAPGKTTSIFGSNQPSAFGGGATFGAGSTAMFGSSQQGAAFGSGPKPAFGGTQQSVFGSGQPSAFGGQQSAPVAAQQTVFGGGQPVIGAQQTMSGAGRQPSFGGMQQSVFGGVNQSSTGGLFSQGQQQTNQGLFTQTNLFGQSNSQQGNIFGKSTNSGASTFSSNPAQTQATSATSGSQNPFLQAAMQNKQQEMSSAVAEVPTELQLSEKDLESYKADRFVLGKVPECPPPLELC